MTPDAWIWAHYVNSHPVLPLSFARSNDRKADSTAWQQACQAVSQTFFVFPAPVLDLKNTSEVVKQAHTNKGK